MNSDLDALLRLFRSERRRTVLELLADIHAEHDSDTVTVRVEDLSRQVAAIDADVTSDTVSHTVHRSSSIELCHSHLPMLNDYGVIEFDADGHEVTATTQTREVARTLRRIVEFTERSGLMETR